MTEWACSAAVQLQPVSGSTWKRLDPYFSSMFLLYSPGSVILLLHPIIASQAWIFLYTQGFMCRFVVNLGSGLRCCSPHVTETYVWFVVSKKKKKTLPPSFSSLKMLSTTCVLLTSLTRARFYQVSQFAAVLGTWKSNQPNGIFAKTPFII